MSWSTEIYDGVTVLVGAERGAYPYSNSLLVRGRTASLVVDPSLSLAEEAPEADLVLVSHAHEDHIAGLGRYDVPVRAHGGDLAALRSREVMVAGLGLPAEAATETDRMLREQFHITGRPEATAFTDGEVFDLGGRTVTVVHLPGHTPGHCGFLVEPDGFLFVADIDLTSFGPYYGDLHSSLPDFEASLRKCREIEARWYGTSHQKGVTEGAAAFRERLDRYAQVVERRDATLLALLREPRTVEEIAAHRLVYRPHVEGPHVRPVERRTAAQHLDRLLAAGLVTDVGDGRYRAR
ncbi:MBL fold metallo-hydrolase [Streptomyces albidoflavus]|uniref:MBL fold metallo-hydrolase n=1 Tax=Streptomyces albidoflavus TaxID=1886 RepID=UPI00101E6909|nr:MBL fold metallo-hydrolase [Streptomyces albidoflavus]RZD89980.1 MBL fold metallo-hydrolase [Streptomyces albidoflavus]RZD93566.1 MBL fold metallo-hydrolase [Streptomyces albidoflavus]